MLLTIADNKELISYYIAVIVRGCAELSCRLNVTLLNTERYFTIIFYEIKVKLYFTYIAIT